MNNGQTTKSPAKFIWIIFAGVVIAVYFFGLTIPLVGPDEPRYTEIAREMFLRGDWVTPKLGGFDWFEKPALLYWIQIVSFKLFGVSEFAARFGSALFGLGTIFCLWLIGRKFQISDFRFQNEDKEHQTTTNEQRATNEFANWLAMIAATSIGLIAFSRGASFDIILTFPITAALAGFFLFDQAESKYTRYFSLAAFYIFVGIALIAKGLIGIVFPFAIVGFYFLLSRKAPGKVFILSLLWGTVISLLVASLWYLPMYQANGWKFIDEFIIQHHFARFTSNKYQHPQPFWFFWVVLPLMTIPWLPFFVASIWDFAKQTFVQLKEAKAQKTEIFLFPFSGHSPLKLFAIAWLLVPLVFFSLSGSKLPGYILPSLPAACILTAGFVFRFSRKNKIRQFAVQSVGFATLAIIAVLVQYVAPVWAGADSVKSLIGNADRAGYSSERVLNLHTISHNAEFYAAGRLIRADDGKLRKFLGPLEVAEQIRHETSGAVLVLVPFKFLHELPEGALFNVEVLGENGELVIVRLQLKQP